MKQALAVSSVSGGIALMCAAVFFLVPDSLAMLAFSGSAFLHLVIGYFTTESHHAMLFGMKPAMRVQPIGKSCIHSTNTGLSFPPLPLFSWDDDGDGGSTPVE